MEIIMFIIFIVTNLFIILCMQFAYTHAYKPINMKMACISMYIFHHLTKKMPKSPKSSPPENAK